MNTCALEPTNTSSPLAGIIIECLRYVWGSLVVLSLLLYCCNCRKEVVLLSQVTLSLRSHSLPALLPPAFAASMARKSANGAAKSLQANGKVPEAMNGAALSPPRRKNEITTAKVETGGSSTSTLYYIIYALGIWTSL